MREIDNAYSQTDSDTLSEALHTDAHPTTDLAFGRGQQYEVAGGQAVLEVFPEHRMSRITTPTSRLELFDTPAPRIVDGQVVISRENGQEPRQTWQEELNLSVSPEGTVVFGYVVCPAAPDEPQTAAETAQEPPAAAPAGDGRAATDTPPEAPLRPSTPWQQHPELVTSDAAPASASRTADTSTKEQQPRVQLTGRLGRDPSFRTSPRGTLVGRFPLAVHRDDGTTVWHSILTFGDRAQQLQHRSDAGELTKGQEVNLIGYQHTREQPTREGGTKTITEIYAVAVTRR